MGALLTSATLIVSVQYKLLPLLWKPPFIGLVLTLTTRSPACQSGFSSASPSNTNSAPSGRPRSISTDISLSACTIRAPLHTGHACLITLPRALQWSHCICTCWYMPGALLIKLESPVSGSEAHCTSVQTHSMCLTIRTPLPWHTWQSTISSLVFAPVPVHWSQVCFLCIVISYVLPL